MELNWPVYGGGKVFSFKEPSVVVLTTNYAVGSRSLMRASRFSKRTNVYTLFFVTVERISPNMSTTTLPITAASFEKVFVRNWAASVARLRRHSSPDGYLVAGESYQDLANWREIAWKALEKEKLGDSLRRAIVSLPIK